MGGADFNEYFSRLFTARWPILKAALLSPNDAVDWSVGLMAGYRLDAASVVAGLALRLAELRPGDEVLDACAAPGGKTLVLAGRLPEGAAIVANELSSERRRRLSDVLDAHLPPGQRGRVKVAGFDAAAAGGRLSERGRFSAILLDAPCSSERHVLSSAKALEEWSPARIKSLAQRQWALLSSCFLMLKPGGSLVYATCALSPAENDGPLGRLLKKYGGEAELDLLADLELEGYAAALGRPALASGAERSEHGVFFSPDRTGGAGPLYVARLRKASA